MSDMRVYNNRGSLSEDDLRLLIGTDILIAMMRNRIIVTADNKFKIDWLEVTNAVTGFYHIRSIDSRNNVYQIWLEHLEDLEIIKKNLMIQKLAEA